jgi:elongation factor G
MALKEAARRAKPVLLEPMMKVEVVVPEEFMGSVTGDLHSRRGRVESTETRLSSTIIQCKVPLSEMFGYSTDLRSMTQGRATYSMHFSHYSEAPKAVSEEVISKVRGKTSS